MEDEEISAADLRTDRGTPARMYDYYLGGSHNFAADREAAERVLSAAPEIRLIARENRAFLGRAVRFLAAEAGIRQFIDLGAGLPTRGVVHEIAGPGVRVVYVDNDPLVHAHARTLLTDDGTTALIDADMREPRQVLGHPDLRRLIDLDEPVAVMFMAVLHFVTDAQDPYGIVAAYRDATAPGSHVAISHITMPESNPEAADRAIGVYAASATSPAVLRSPKEVTSLFDGYDVVDPGVVYVPQWRPGDRDSLPDPDSVWIHGGVGRRS